jgi:hypothetical protein
MQQVEEDLGCKAFVNETNTLSERCSYLELLVADQVLQKSIKAPYNT